MKNRLLFAFVMAVVMMMGSANVAWGASGLTFVRGTDNASALIDNSSYEWNTAFSTSDKPYIIMKHNSPNARLWRYRLLQCKASQNYDTYRWTGWSIYGANFDNDDLATKDADGWVLIDSRSNYNNYQTTAYNSVNYNCTENLYIDIDIADAPRYQYYKIVVDKVYYNCTRQVMAELDYSFDTCLHPNLITHETVEPTQNVHGCTFYQECPDCKLYFDGNGRTTQSNPSAIIHNLVAHEAHEATCYSQGNKAYSECTVCNAKFDSNGKSVTDANIIIAKKAHTYTNGVCSKCGSYIQTYGQNDGTSVYPYGENHSSTTIMLYSGENFESSGLIADMEFYCVTSGKDGLGIHPTSDIKIYLAETELTTLSTTSAINPSIFTEVYSGTIQLGPKAGDWEKFSFSNKFNFDKSKNLLVAFTRYQSTIGSNSPTYACTNSSQSMRVSTTSSSLNYHDLSNVLSNIGNGITPTRDNVVPYVRFYVDSAPFTLDGDNDVYAAEKAHTHPYFTFTRNFEGGNWTTWYEPFELTLTDELLEKFAFSRINNVHQYDDDEDGEADRTVIESFRMKEGATLEANYPYLVKSLDENKRFMKLERPVITLAPSKENGYFCMSMDYTYIFTGTYQGKDYSDNPMNSPFSLFDDDEKGWEHFTVLPAQRHYLTIQSRNDNQQAPERISLRVIGEEETNGIVELYEEARKESVTYDLTGRQLKVNGQQRGLRIVNGKLIYVK